MKKPIDYSKIADIYDTYVQESFDIPFFLNEAERSSGEVLELTSGTGRVSIPLLESGIPLTCVDNSPEMLAILKKKMKEKGLTGSVHQADIRGLSLEKQFDLIFIPFHSFSELLSPSDQTRVLTSIYNHLSESGRFICTLHNPAVRLQTSNGNLHLFRKVSLPDQTGTILLWGLEDYDPKSQIVHISQFIEIYNSNNVMQIKHHVDGHYFVHEKETFEELLRSNGYKIIDVYGDYEYSRLDEDKSPFMIWVLVK